MTSEFEHDSASHNETLPVVAWASAIQILHNFVTTTSLASASVTQIYSRDYNAGIPSTLDNAIIAGLDASKIRVATGSSDGKSQDRGFTFVILGK